MSKFKTTGYKKSIEYANKGIRAAMKSERNFRFQIFFAVLVIITAIFLKFSIVELCLIVISAAFVLVAELFNSAIEFAIDSVYHNRKNTLVGFAKDMSAGAVLISTISAIIIGTILFSNKIFDLVVPGYFWF